MEIRASYLLVGAVVLALLAALAAFSVWLVQADVDRQVALYEIAHEGSVAGLPVGGQVLYRGIPVGRVAAIRINPDNVEQVLVEVEIEQSTPIKADTIATLESQGITGIAYVQLDGGTQDSPVLAAEGDALPRIPSRPSALERVFKSTPELLGEALVVADRLSNLLDDDNLQAVGATLGSLETFTGTLAARSGSIDEFLGGAGTAAGRIETVSADLELLTAELRQMVGKADQKLDGVGGDLVDTLSELRIASASLGGAADQLGRIVGDLREPLGDFASTGLYEFTQLVGESRLLIAALTRITKEFERNPAGFLIGNTRGYQAE
jgi:phospholipid/cholesterol/gamma-HCH transport system substrate-binding protein